MKRTWLTIVAVVAVVGALASCQAPFSTREASGDPGARAAGAPTWNASAVYVKGNRVAWVQRTWEAKWWTQGEEPGTTGQWGVWKDVGPIGGDDATPPTAPGNPVFSDVTWNSASVAWSAATDDVGVTGYELTLGTAAPVAVSGTTWRAAGLAADTLYAVKVVALDAAGNRGPAATGSFHTAAAPVDTVPPSAPGVPAAASITATGATVSWTAATDNVAVVGYELTVGANPPVRTTVLSVQVSALAPDTEYSLSVLAYDAAGNRGPAAAGSFRTLKDGGLPSAPKWTALIAYSGGKRVYWEGNIWEARWWTKGETPSASSQVWKLIGPGVEGDSGTNPDTLPDFGPVGQPRVISDADVQKYWGGIDPRYLPDAVAGAVQALLPAADYEQIFPMRYGSPGWLDYNNQTSAVDYYAYPNLVDAVKELAGIMLMVENRGYAQRITRLDKATRTQVVLRMDKDINEEWMLNKPLVRQVVDYGKFLGEGTDVQKKQDLAAFLGNISHETTGGWETAPGGRFSWGLYYKEEVGYDDTTVGQYVSATDPNYPPVAGQSYHGRGPIQLSWNYNYGFMSEVVFGDKNVLLRNPKQVAHDGKLGFKTAIWFWMTPQPPKPSCHDVMTGKWIPTADDLAANRRPGFGTTINVINGGLEAGKPNDYRVVDRIGFYMRVCDRMAVPYGDNIDCYDQRPF